VLNSNTELPKRQPGIGNDQLRQACICNFTLDQCCNGAFGGDVRQIGMTIEAWPGQRDEQLARFDGPAVCADGSEAGIRSDQAARQR
jgi:hypothetical protein